mgnify:FL=1|tara:strand:- start:21 stop:371 length:351 start_codon:yes stop_codon:yes gene_type:complete
MNRENTERYSAITDAPEKTVTQLKEENERLTQALYDAQKLKEQLRDGLFNLLEPSLDQWLKESADDFLETHFDITNYTDDIADALPEREIDFDSYQDEIRDVVQDIVKYAEVKITV